MGEYNRRTMYETKIYFQLKAKIKREEKSLVPEKSDKFCSLSGKRHKRRKSYALCL